MVRSGDSVGTISVDYGIVYLPVGVTDPVQGDSSVVTMATGSVQLQGGQVLKEFNVTISEDAFLEPRANFYVYLNSTILVGGGTCACIRVTGCRTYMYVSREPNILSANMTGVAGGLAVKASDC